MTEYERLLMHKALWVWLAENPGKDKYHWPGWGLVKDRRSLYYRCFLCNKGGCGNCRFNQSANKTCLDNLFNTWAKVRRYAERSNTWINRRAVTLAAYRIAFVPWKVKPEPSFSDYMKTLRRLEKAYGEDTVRFVPADKKDYDRFFARMKANEKYARF